MKTEEIEKMVALRQSLIRRFESLRDYKNNQNAIMKETEHAKLIHDVVVEIDDLLKEYVTFK